MTAQRWERESLLRAKIEILAEEFRGTFSIETIANCVRESLDGLEDTAITDYVPIFVERYARERLRAMREVAGSGNRSPHS
jgi:hypothetical protein